LTSQGKPVSLDVWSLAHGAAPSDRREAVSRANVAWRFRCGFWLCRPSYSELFFRARPARKPFPRIFPSACTSTGERAITSAASPRCRNATHRRRAARRNASSIPIGPAPPPRRRFAIDGIPRSIESSISEMSEFASPWISHDIRSASARMRGAPTPSRRSGR